MVLGPILYFAIRPFYPIPFHRAMDRALMVSALAALSLVWSRIPFRELWPREGAGMGLLVGYALALVSAQAFLGAYLACCGFTNSGLSLVQIGARVLMALVAALLVPPLEETLFRGFLQGEMTRGLGRYWGWWLTAVIFMLAHFFKVPTDLDGQPVHVWSGVTAIGAAFGQIGQGTFVCGKGLNLFLLGLILGGIVLRTGSLWVNAGLHSGMILLMLLFTGLARPIDPPRIPWLGGDILSSFVTTVVFVLLGLWLWRFYRHPSDVPGNGANAP